MFYGLHLMLSNASLSVIPSYVMGMFLLADGLHAQFDKVQTIFLREGGETRVPHGQGGIINSKVMNVELLIKPIWKLRQNPSSLLQEFSR